MRKSLIVIDLQLDFLIANLKVDGGEEATKRLCEHLKNIDNDYYSNIIVTKDWHIKDHPSFEVNGGIWPIHCVQDSFGSNLPYELIETLSMETNAPITFVLKGQEKEAYSAFEEVEPELANIFRRSDEIHVAGVAGDYCVKKSVEDLIEKGWGKKIKLLDPCIASINEDEYEKFIGDNQIKIITEYELQNIK